MCGLRFNAVVVLLILNGVLLEINHAYKQAMSIPSHVLPQVTRSLQLPAAMHNSPLAETPLVRSFDQMTMTSGMVVFFDEEYSE